VGSGITVDGFIDGMVAGLAVSGVESLNSDQLDRRLVDAFHMLEDEAEDECELRFHLELNPLTNSCQTAKVAVDRAVKRGVLTRHKDRLEVVIDSKDAKHVFRRLPLKETTWVRLANKVG
jgi:hypothetical protein